jgi:Ca-activated chloride channel family protein
MTHVHLPLTPDWLLWPVPWVHVLFLLLLLPALWVLWLLPRMRPVIRFSNLSLLRDVRAGWRRHMRWSLPVLRTVAVGCLIVGAARPQRPIEDARLQVEGIAIQMVLDTSTSMLDEDLSAPGRHQTRIDVVKDVFKRFVAGDKDQGGKLEGRPNDLIGMIRFAAYADSVCPLTLDHEALLNVLEQTRTVMWLGRDGRWHGNREEDGTAIGDGLALAVERLRDLRRTIGTGEQLIINSRVVILLTDGENNQGMLTPLQAGKLAAMHGIKVYTILAGTGQRGPWGQRYPVDDSELREIAEITGGRFYRSDNREGLEKVYADIDQLERTRIEELGSLGWEDLSWPWLMAAFAFLSVQTLLDATLLRKIP